MNHRWLEGQATLFAVLSTVAILIGTAFEIAPMFTDAGPQKLEGVTPYTPLELAGRDIYVREGCYVCHSQMVRPFRDETLRYGEWSRAGEFVYDRPFQLGSRRIGPDLHRVGGKYPDAWHYEHMRDPRATSVGSVMPPYPWLLDWKVDPADVHATVTAMHTLGAEYTAEEVTQAGVSESLQTQGDAIVGRLAEAGITTESDREIVALIAYLQRLGVDGRKSLATEVAER